MLALTGACIPNIDVSADGGTFIAGPSGGIFSRQGATFDIPRNALDQDTEITVQVIDTGVPEVPMRKRISYGYRIFPTTLVFKQPVKVILPWIPERVPQAVDPGTFDERRQAGTQAYEQLPNAKTLLDFKAVEAQSDRLGLFWLTSPSQPNVARLELDPMELVMQVGDKKPLNARVVDPTGATLDAGVTWTVVPPRVASVSPDGEVTALDPGTARVVARSGDQSAEAKISVIGTTVGPSTFVSENPYPTGNDLFGGLSIGVATAFVGANGTVLVEDLQGKFTRLFSSPGLVLKAVAGTLDNAVAVGAVATQGVVIELKKGQSTPKITTFQNVQPRAVWFDGTFGLAVGDGDDVIVYRNGAWVRDDSPTREGILSLSGDGQGGFVVLGNLGSLYQYDPGTKAWNSLYRTTLQVLLTAGSLVGTQGGEAWAVGGNQLWHFQGAGWQPLALPVDPHLEEATALGTVDGKVVIGGRNGRVGYALLYAGPGDGGVPPVPDAGPPDAGLPDSGDVDSGLADAGDPDAGEMDGGDPDAGFDAGMTVDAGTPLPPGWALVTLRKPQIPRGFIPAGATAFLVGDVGAIYQYVGGTFLEQSRGFYGDVADVYASDAGAFAAVNECLGTACTAKNGAVYARSANGSWDLLGAPQPFGGEVFAVTARGKDVLVSLNNAVYRWDGAAWTAIPLQGGLQGPLYDLQWCSGSLYGVGQGGVVFKGGATLLSYQGTVGGRTLRSIHCPSDSQIWVAGDRGLFSRATSGMWSSRTTMGVNHADYYAVWSPGENEAFAFGDSRYGVYWDTEQLNVVDSPGGLYVDVATGLWGSSIDNLYMVGKTLLPSVFGFALRFDGVQWRLVDSGSQRPVTSISGSSRTEIYLGTEGGGLLRGVIP